MTLEVTLVPIEDAEGVAEYCRIRSTVDPDRAQTPESARWEADAYPGEVWLLLARLDGEAVGAANVGRLYVFAHDHPEFFLGLWVLEHARRRGVGTALYRAASRIARDAGKTGFRTWVSERQCDLVAYLLARGFTEQDRSKVVSLDLRPLRGGGPDGAPAAQLPDAPPPDGIDLVTIADRPDLVAGVHAAAVEAYPSIPTSTPMQPGTLEEFISREVYRDRVPTDAFFVAVDRATGEVAGYASLIYASGSTSRAHHDMTAVRPAYRGRGIALALKRATIVWAIAAGLDELEANNDEENAPMRGINARLGYKPRADDIGLAGPLARDA